MDNHWKEYLSFTKKERFGILILLLIIVISVILPFYFSPPAPGAATIAEFEQKLALLQSMQPDSAQQPYDSNAYLETVYEPVETHEYRLFPFDPNTLDRAGWQQLGIREKTIAIIQNYVAKGGRFYKPEDLQKIYGLQKEEYDRLAPYIRIKSKATASGNIDIREIAGESSTHYKKTISSVEINTADTSAFIALPGIGSKLANRLIHFREKLGGFYSVEQVAELYGLPDSTFQHIRQWLHCDTTLTRKININTAHIDSLRQHPYITRNLANALVQYRQQHGPYASVKTIRQIAIVTPEIYRKLVLYLSVE